jgi:hypothetical protein
MEQKGDLMHLPARTTLLAALLLSPLTSLLAQTAADLTGHWEGSIQAPTKEVRIEVDLAKNGQGELEGTFNNPAQNLKGLPLSNFSVEGRAVSFQIKGAPGERAFKGDLSADAKSISGDYNQSGYSVRFSLTRTGDPRIEAPAKSAPIAKELEGVWNGTLDAHGKQMRVVLTMANQPDGTATGSFVSVDEGLEIPIATITQKASSVTLDVKAVGGSYSGALNNDATELAGTYTQGSLVLSLNFRRSAENQAKK